MIIFMNGTFGVGKTTVAEKLVKQIPDSILFDPEEVGFMLRNILGDIDPQDDFQHYPAWRRLTIETARNLKKSHKNLAIPMTIWREEYFTEVVDGLKQIDTNFHHFCLTAPIEVVHDRLSQRAEQRPGSWAHKQASQAISALKSELFSRHISADKKTPAELVQIITTAIS